MKKITIAVLCLLSLCSCKMKQTKPDLLGLVDPNIGSVHSRWFFYTPAAMPWGMAKLAPQTNGYGSEGGWYPCGYDDRHTSIEGFSHFHEFQIGGVVTMPVVGQLKTLPGTLEDPDSGYRSRFDKDDESASPGYYSVLLKDYGVRAELTATRRVGFHRYTFPASNESYILFDLGHPQGESGPVVDTHAEYMPESNTIEGWVETYPTYAISCQTGGHVRMHFVAELDKRPDSVGTFIDDTVTRNSKTVSGVGSGMFLQFSTTEGEQVNMKVGLSYTSIGGARKNLIAEAEDKTFDIALQRARDEWYMRLGFFEVEGGTREDRVKFYTALYHVLLGRGLASDVDGSYCADMNRVVQVPLNEKGRPRHHHYNTDGVWGGFWNLTQLWALAYPEYYRDYVKSALDFYRNRGWLHDGEAAGIYTNGVQTNFMGLIICAAHNYGLIDEKDIPLAYEAALKNDMGWEDRDFGSGRYDNRYFVEQGYIPLKDFVYPGGAGWTHNFGASHTLEYTFSAYATSQFAKSLGKEDDYRMLTRYANSYKLLYDPSIGYIRPREENGEFTPDYDYMKAWKGFQEGNGFQYTWYAPHDMAGLFDMIGLDEVNRRLEMQFSESRKSKFGGGEDINSFSGVETLYNQGNQPCLHQPWMFNYSGKPWLTQLYTRLICDEFYGTGPLHGYGYGQDEDQGQLGAWYVMSSIGLFDVQGGTRMDPTFQIGSPKFDKITIHLHPKYYGGNRIIIKTRNNSRENYYVQSAIFNGRPIKNLWLNHSAFRRGGELILEMGPEPNTKWGVGTLPPSMSTDE